MIIPAQTCLGEMDNTQSDSFIGREMQLYPERYATPGCNSYIDHRTLVHVISDVDCPEGVDYDTFMKVMGAVAETTELVPYFSFEDLYRLDAECKLPYELF